MRAETSGREVGSRRAGRGRMRVERIGREKDKGRSREGEIIEGGYASKGQDSSEDELKQERGI
jgi:hypothetical protein